MATVLLDNDGGADASEREVNSRVPILLVDDNPSKRLALTAVLSPLGYSIIEADSGLAALRCVMTQDFAVILLDVRMPDMDGFETAALIRQRRESEITPIIFITAYGSDELVNPDLYAAGAVDFIFAPVPPEQLRAKVSAFACIFRKAEKLATQARDVKVLADRLRLLTDAAPIGIFQTDVENRYVYTNPGWTEITGVSSEDAAGRPWDVILCAQERARLTGEFAAEGSAEISGRFEITREGAQTRVALVTSKSIPGRAGGIEGWVGTLADVTAEADAEAAMAEAHDKATETSERITLLHRSLSMQQNELEIANRELAASARRDPLTELGNRRALEDDLELLEARVLRYGHRYCMAILDVDHFKSYNDTYGHQAGDQILRLVAAQLRDQARGGDALYRYGGDEFLCVFPEQSMARAAIAVERMRFAIETLAFPHIDNPFGMVTISAGLSTLDPDNSRSASEVLRVADATLYRAKHLGRNRVEQADGATV